MPYSHPDAIAFVQQLVRKYAEDVEGVVDVGAGAGAQTVNLRSVLPNADYIAIEKWAPYIDQFELGELYDKVIVADVTWLDWLRLERSLDYPALVVFGDVLEHLAADEAAKVWRTARKHANWVIASIPITEYPQGPEHGNPYEAHIAQWNHNAVIETFEGIEDYVLGDVVGAYIAKGLPC